MAESADRLLPYDVRFETEVCAGVTGEPDEYVIDIRGAVRFTPEETEPMEVGSIFAHLVQLGRAINDGFPFDDIFDVSQELYELFDALFDERTSQLREVVRDEFEVISSDILFLSSIEIDAPHRGLGVGLAVASRCIDVWAPSEGLVVCKPFPLQFDSSRRNDAAWSERIGATTFVNDKQAATRKLASYWGRLGFEPVAETHYAALSMTNVRPALEKALRPKRARTSRTENGRPLRGRRRA